MTSPVPHDLHLALSDAVLAISAAHDLDGVLQMIADQARVLGAARYAAVGVPSPDGRRLERFVTSGLTADEVERIATAPRGQGLLGVMLREGRPLSVPDISADPRAAGVPPHHPQMRTLLGVPIKRGEEVLGQLYVADKVGGAPFTGADEEVLELLSRHAALAIAGTRLVERLTESEARYRMLTQGAPEILFSLDADGRIAFVNERTRAVTGFEPAIILGRRLRDLVRPEDRPVVDLHLDALASGSPSARFGIGAIGSDGRVRDFEVSLMGQSIPGAGFQGIALDATERRGREREMSERASAALHTGEECEDLRGLVALVIQAQEDERARIAGDLHDTVVQTLTAIARRLRVLSTTVADRPEPTARELDELAEAALHEAGEMRRLSRDLRPSVLDHLGLAAALRNLADELRAAGVAVDLDVAGDTARLDGRQRTALFRIAQEAFTNVRRHARATRVDVRLVLDADEVRMTIADDGQGFEVGAVPALPHAGSERLGLVGMRERAALLGGALRVASRPGAGTRIVVVLPLARC